ncbi:polysaccharide deacetylase family sporulation protein PdaB [Alkalihalophilus pseudofirmus]|uniref:polysaccharide deacetylase family sporulation protein PdaB n=1 Tax=Alkalihalobacterium alkalinitrilicum TaxID=427920 RepID=UPI00094CF00C|nr:polysaccharide deacetylase family sporulation protein PdaB [Alkalihalobacterium alkalinitrilicum]OLO27132.1 polysaccharide deacetylase family sporulation protein PdaB [Alkalihalophilus pseudofirmus]
MKFFLVWNGKKIKQLSIIIVAAFFTAGLLFVERNELMVFSTSDGPQAFHKAKTDDKVMSLTFNISWGDQRALPILDILKDKNVQATFFLSGAWAERHPDTVKRIVEDGHEIGNHGYQYESYPSWDDEKIKKDIRRGDQVLTELTEKKPTLLRPPHGQFDKRVLGIADKLDYSIVHWSVNTNDWENPGVDQIVDQTLEQSSKGDVILFHASDSVKQTHKALPIILDRLKSKGYQFTTVTELIASTTTKSEEIK